MCPIVAWWAINQLNEIYYDVMSSKMKETPNFYLVRKPSGIPSTWGQKYCFLDYIKDNRSPYEKSSSSFSFDQQMSRKEEREVAGFTSNDEYGLLNRLDNETSWVLYFAKTMADYELYRSLQSKHLIKKYYVANVYGRMRGEFWRICTPITHHPTDETKMQTLIDKNIHYRSQWQNVRTYRECLWYDEECDVTTLLLTITKWVRHQIRCHLASLGYPIINDAIYTTAKQRKKRKKQGRYKDKGVLGLMSVWICY